MRRLQERIQQHIDKINGTVGIYIKNLNNNKTIIINGDERFHSASIIKIPILWEGLRQVEIGMKTLEETIALKKEDKVGGCGVLTLLQEGLELTLEDLLHLMVDISDNTATNMLIDHLGRDNINATLQSMGMKNTYLARKLMMVIPETYNYTTPKDIGSMLERFVIGNGLNNVYAEKGMEILSKQQLNDCFSKELRLCGTCNERVGHHNLCPTCSTFVGDVDPKPVRFSHKTGSISGVVHDAGVMDLGERKVVLVGLTKGLDSNEIGKQLLADIGLEVYHYFLDEEQTK
ncbi:beta-lactamase class A [Natronincola peptidivorans]|uniref:Beta-lactamase class A n=1 Tax=Natronincola peptidivorans TaxID=426128 RepID=A0A1I0FZL7_9FIRM|nr:serine hydrolase [Natronincola peptidivorans]SET63732.1 beta-lactamase class A [Natronincola peptidivorans]